VAIMALTLYQRHNQQCEGKHPLDSQSLEREERAKTWRKCGCSIYASGSMAKRHKRPEPARYPGTAPMK